MGRVLLVTSLLLCLLLRPAMAQGLIYQGHVRLDGGQKNFSIDVCYPYGEDGYLAVETLAREFRWTLVDDGRSATVSLQGHAVKAVRYKGKTYVPAQSVADAMKLRLEQKPEHRWFDFWTPATASPGSARLSLQERKKWDLRGNREVSYDVRVTVRNQGSAVLPLTAANFVLVDRKGTRYPNLGTFNVGVPPAGESTFWGPYFTVPYQHDLYELLLVGPSGEVLDRARW